MPPYFVLFLTFNLLIKSIFWAYFIIRLFCLYMICSKFYFVFVILVNRAFMYWKYYEKTPHILLILHFSVKLALHLTKYNLWQFCAFHSISSAKYFTNCFYIVYLFDKYFENQQTVHFHFSSIYGFSHIWVTQYKKINNS